MHKHGDGVAGERLYQLHTGSTQHDVARRALPSIDRRHQPPAEYPAGHHVPPVVLREALAGPRQAGSQVTAVRVEHALLLGANPVAAKVPTHRYAFRYLWRDIGGNWKKEPWVRVIEFKRLKVAGG